MEGIVSQELLQAVAVLTKEKGFQPEVIFESLEVALLLAYRRDPASNPEATVEIDRKTGEYHVFAKKEVVEVVTASELQISLEDARAIHAGCELGDTITVEVTPENFSRTAAQTAKQMLIQRLREAERSTVFDQFSEREGDIVTGLITRVDGKSVFVEVDTVEAFLPVQEQMESDVYEVGKRMKFYLVEVKKMTKGPQILISRTHPGLLKKLFELEVPEIADGIVEIMSIAREPGMRSKIAVFSHDAAIDAVGACVGAKGQRVQNIVDELGDEKIDIIKWDEDPAIYIANALSPAKAVMVAVNEEEKISHVVVADYQLSLAIGKAGQNARLAAKLTNWKIDIKSESQAEADPFEESGDNDVVMEEL